MTTEKRKKEPKKNEEIASPDLVLISETIKSQLQNINKRFDELLELSNISLDDVKSKIKEVHVCHAAQMQQILNALIIQKDFARDQSLNQFKVTALGLGLSLTVLCAISVKIFFG